MIRLINKVTGTEMMVAENRVAKYLAAGHRLAVELVKPEQPIKDGKPQPKRTARKKR